MPQRQLASYYLVSFTRSLVSQSVCSWQYALINEKNGLLQGNFSIGSNKFKTD